MKCVTLQHRHGQAKSGRDKKIFFSSRRIEIVFCATSNTSNDLQSHTKYAQKKHLIICAATPIRTVRNSQNPIMAARALICRSQRENNKKFIRNDYDIHYYVSLRRYLDHRCAVPAHRRAISTRNNKNMFFHRVNLRWKLLRVALRSASLIPNMLTFLVSCGVISTKFRFRWDF